jgi:curved DNA-binding protein CbpA
MDSTVKLRPTYYETLGLTPEASSDEIAQAFARELSLPRPFGSLAEVTIAYETLRDPTKRKAYDSAIGLEPEPPTPRNPSPEAPAEWAPFLVRASAKPAERPRPDPVPPPASPEANQGRRPEPRPEPRTAPRLAPRSSPSATALLRQPIRPVPSDIQPVLRTRPEELRRPKAVEEPKLEKPAVEAPRPEPQSAGERQFQPSATERFYDSRRTSIAWRVPAMAAGALVLAVGVGAWTGWEAGNDNEQPAVTLKVPKAKALPVADESPPTPANAEAQAEQPRRAAAPTARAASIRPPLRITLPDEQQSELALLEQRQRELETEQAAPQAPAVEPTAARLPLPDAVVARTIGRIGYPCGQVASTAALSPGVFKVTCTSGHSYRAAPVNGRYRFRRLGS